ncbi:MAG: glycosyltransferase family 9 protein [Pseudomonadota bacterium]
MTNTNMRPRRICLLRLSAIGDCCHALALVRTLQQALPDAELTWVIGATEARLLQGLEGVELLVYDKHNRAAQAEFGAALRRREFDVLLNLHASWRANRVSRWIRAPRKIGFDRARARDAQWLFTNESVAPQHQPHVLDGFFAFAERLGVTERHYRWQLPLAPTDYALADALLQDDAPTILISPCSSERAHNFRNWPAEQFAALARYAAETYGARTFISGTGTALELEYAETIAAAVPDHVQDLVGKTSLKQLAALIERADVVVAPDSGPVHIATAVGTPVIGLYATSNPRRTGPSIDADYTVNVYPQALQQFLDKTEDEVRWGQRVRHAEALSLISLTAVKAALDRVFSERPTRP